MYKNKAPDGTHNLCGKTLTRFRENHKPPLSQRGLARLLQLNGCDVDHYFVSRVENGERFVTDIEIKMLAEALGLTYAQLIDGE